MVPEHATLTKRTHSILLKTFLNILNHLKTTSIEKQKSILDQDWDKLSEIAQKQEQLKQYIEENQRALDDLSSKDSQLFKAIKSEPENKALSTALQNTLNEYREIEKTNVKLLNDALYCARQKVTRLFKLKPKCTYSKSLNQDVALWSENPVLLDKRI